MNNSQKYTKEGQILLKRIDSTISLIGPARKALENHGSENVIFKQKIEKVSRSVGEIVKKITEVKREFVKQAASIEKKNLNSNVNYKKRMSGMAIMKMDAYIAGLRKAIAESGKAKLLGAVKNKTVSNTVAKLKEGAALRNSLLSSGKAKLLAGAASRAMQKGVVSAIKNSQNTTAQKKALNNFERQLKQIRTSVNKNNGPNGNVKNNGPNGNVKNKVPNGNVKNKVPNGNVKNKAPNGFVQSEVARIEGSV